MNDKKMCPKCGTPMLEWICLSDGTHTMRCIMRSVCGYEEKVE